MVTGVTQELMDSLKEVRNLEEDEETTFQIRIYDDNTAKVAYKYLTKRELRKVFKALKTLEWV